MYDETVTVVENRPLTGGHFLLSVHSPRQAQATRPGQFAMVRLLCRSDVLLRRPMSIYDVAPGTGIPLASLRACPPAPAVGRTRPVAPVSPAAMRTSPLHRAGGPLHGRLRPPHQKAEIIQLLYKVVGRGTRLMAELKPGDRV